jgi:benzoyl-CoA reductase/2-hydroxyglutaryl-CoA dehydratase subunit BcrC/BadD/HgdB
MLSWIIQFTIISVILIFLVHHLINFFTTTLTVPKIKDLVNSPNNEYKNIYEIIKNNPNKLNTSNDSNNYSLIDLLPNVEEEPSMKNELKNFLKKQLNSSSSEISGLDSMSNFQSYSKL